MAQRYKLSFESLLSEYSIWKRNAIIDDIANKKNSGLLTEFIGNVIISAELQEVANKIERIQTLKTNLPN